MLAGGDWNFTVSATEIPIPNAGTVPPVIALKDVSKEFRTGSPWWPWSVKRLRAVDHVTLEVAKGETFGIVGESGCGKSTIAKMLLLLEAPTGGEVRFHGRNTAALAGKDLRSFRRRVQAVLQDPYSSLNPRMSVGDIISEPMTALGIGTRSERSARVQELMQQVGLNPDFRKRYPHQFSGGQQQRVAIARALSVEPEVLILDEPTSALDVSVRTQILRLLTEVKAQLSLTMVFISHDLAVVEQVCDRIGVMYAGELVESGPAPDIILRPKHPYTQALIMAVPSPDPDQRTAARRLVEGEIPDPLNLPQGCRFHTRCPLHVDICSSRAPALIAVDSHRAVACHCVTGEAHVQDFPGVITVEESPGKKGVGHV